MLPNPPKRIKAQLGPNPEEWIWIEREEEIPLYPSKPLRLKKYRILRQINQYNIGDIVSEEHLPLKLLCKVRNYNVLIVKNKFFEIIEFQELNKKEALDYAGFYVERIP
jgi:ribosomal protein S17